MSTLSRRRSRRRAVTLIDLIVGLVLSGVLAVLVAAWVADFVRASVNASIDTQLTGDVQLIEQRFTDDVLYAISCTAGAVDGPVVAITDSSVSWWTQTPSAGVASVTWAAVDGQLTRTSTSGELTSTGCTANGPTDEQQLISVDDVIFGLAAGGAPVELPADGLCGLSECVADTITFTGQLGVADRRAPTLLAVPLPR